MITLQQAAVALGGGVLIGTAATVLLAFNGRVAGISGILGGLVPPKVGDADWRVTFLVGMVLAGLVLSPALPGAFTSLDRPLWTIVLSGLLVGVGTRLGNGCTSGHGVCGMARFSKRSMAAVGAFMVTGILTATVVGQLLGGVA
ncbi:MAG: YeeE/YedE family protein [Candidatus Poseidonia sp.]|nr:YeeE/YedE family protein [Poseidonia sp.]